MTWSYLDRSPNKCAAAFSIDGKSTNQWSSIRNTSGRSAHRIILGCLSWKKLLATQVGHMMFYWPLHQRKHPGFMLILMNELFCYQSAVTVSSTFTVSNAFGFVGVQSNLSSRSSPWPWITPDILILKSATRHLECIYNNTLSISDWKILCKCCHQLISQNNSCRQAFILLFTHLLLLFLKSSHSLEYHKQHP